MLQESSHLHLLPGLMGHFLADIIWRFQTNAANLQIQGNAKIELNNLRDMDRAENDSHTFEN